MGWLSRLSFAQALRWALVWPGLLLLTAVGAVVFVITTNAQDDWAFAWGGGTTGPLPVWLAMAIAVASAFFGPSVVFLSLWKVARR